MVNIESLLDPIRQHAWDVFESAWAKWSLVGFPCMAIDGHRWPILFLQVQASSFSWTQETDILILILSPNPKSLQESPSLFTQPRTRPSISIHPPFHHPKAHLDSYIGRQHPEVSMADGVRDVFVADGLQQAHSHIRKPRIGPEGALACQSLEVGNLFMV